MISNNGSPNGCRIAAATEFVMSRVQRPALSCASLPKEIKSKVRHSDIWLRQFKRVGDLYAYLERFSTDENDQVYLEMKSHGLETFEDIKTEFAARFRDALGDRTRPTDFIIGETYSPHEILIYAQSYDTRGGGMFTLSSDAKPHTVVIKATLHGGTYANKWLEPSRRLKYYFKAITRNGLQEFGDHFKANSAILLNPEIPILTFVRQAHATPFTFHGTFRYADHHSEGDGSKWFELALSESQPDAALTDSGYLDSELDARIASALAGSRTDRLARLRNAPKKPVRVMVRTTTFLRNADVIAEVLERAKGHCEECMSPAPFMSRAKNEPYLEVHHKMRLADGGDDTVENAIALCPNCHRKSHFG